jgi:hypothetical protein
MLTTQTKDPAASATQPIAPRFTLADADRAHDEWGANCGPGALAAIMGMTLDEVRPHLIGFDYKRYTNPTMMFDALKSIGAKYRSAALGYALTPDDFIGWPRYGLVRIQWEGPWTRPEVPMRARYRYTHWVGGQGGRSSYGVFDINCMNNGTGWCSLQDWTRVIAPHLISQYPRASGKWHITHSIEIKQPTTGRP